MKTSPEIKQLAAALAKAQANIEGAKKDSKNPFFKSDYADLASVWDAIRQPLAENGLSVVQTCENPTVVMPDSTVAVKDTRIVTVVTRLCHESGEWIEGALSLSPVTKKDKDDNGRPIQGAPNIIDPQSMGSAITYARRYALAAMVGVYQVDDDANGASQPPSHRPEAIETIGAEGAKQVLQALKDCGADIEKLYEAMTQNGVDVKSTDVAKWPKGLMPRIFKWCEARKQVATPPPATTSTPVAERMKAVRGKQAPHVPETAPV